MSADNYFITDQNAVYFLTFTVTDWIDIYTRKEYKFVKIISEIFESRKEWMLYLFEFVGKFDNRIKKYKFWQDTHHAILLDTSEMIPSYAPKSKIIFKRMNPDCKNGIVH